MGEIRKFVEDDLPAIVALFGLVFGRTQPFPPEDLYPYFQRIFFGNPWLEEDLPSLVYQDGGAITGFLGVIPRRMMLGNRPIRLAVSNHFMVDPRRRSALVAVELLRAFFSGPQDLSLAEGGDTSRKVWEGLGGHTSLLNSLYWTRPLRPSRYFIHQLAKQGFPAPLVSAFSPFCRVLDSIASRIPHNPFQQVPQVPENSDTTETFLNCLMELSQNYALRPWYNTRSLQWLMDILQEKKRHGNLRKVVVRSPEGTFIGCYVYYLNPGGVSEVLQICARVNCMRSVLDHLFYHAWRQGALGATGRLDPKFMQEFSDRYCFFYRGDRPCMQVHSRYPEVLETFSRGEAFLSRMEGEWWISFPGG